MKIGEQKERRDMVVSRMLEIEATLAEMKRKWLVEGVEGPLGVRATLEAEYAALKCEKNDLLMSLHAWKKAEQALRQATFTATLVRLLKERDLAQIVKDAERISTDALLSMQHEFSK